jgi:hypothetical protein
MPCEIVAIKKPVALHVVSSRRMIVRSHFIAFRKTSIGVPSPSRSGGPTAGPMRARLIIITTWEEFDEGEAKPQRISAGYWPCCHRIRNGRYHHLRRSRLRPIPLFESSLSTALGGLIPRVASPGFN